MIQLSGHLSGTRNPVDICQTSSRRNRAQEQFSQCWISLGESLFFCTKEEKAYGLFWDIV